MDTSGITLALVTLGSFVTSTFLQDISLTPDPSQGDKYRPQFHFSIPTNWINDPNGMVYLDGEYHLHYQFNPFAPVWGPMYWGHSVSTDLVKWTNLPVALVPDELGDIFSGSAVVDFDNSTGFQSGDNVPIIAIFTHAGQSQQQSIAFSNDKGRFFAKYNGNPVIPNPGIPDFRDPKVIRFQDKWILLLAAGDRIMFYSSSDLKSWEYLSEFGKDPEQGAHTGVWECPDFFPLDFLGQSVWVLIVSINPGGPNGGSSTQYFVGGFDGRIFVSSQLQPLWMDMGVDNYASVSFFNDPEERVVMMGWMNNWDYANQLPTLGWRGQMTLPRVLGLTLTTQGTLRLTSEVVEEVKKLYKNDTEELTNQIIPGEEIIEIGTNGNELVHLDLTFDTREMADGASLAVCFMNSMEQEVCFGYDKGRETPVFLDRERSGLVDFNPSFSRRASSVREISDGDIRFEAFLDVSAIELFVDGGLTCFTMLYYPDEPYNMLEVRHHANGNEGSVINLSRGFVQGMNKMSDV